MLRSLRTPLLLVLGFAALLALGGCSNMPTAPVLQDNSATTAASVSAEALGATAVTSATKTKTVGLLGGVVSAGDFTVVIPPGALLRTCEVTVTQPDVNHSVVNLSISPASANRFLVPVILTAKADRLSPALLSLACLSYYNPTTGNWENLASTVSLLNLTISTPLSHFSTYRVTSGGKAGW